MLDPGCKVPFTPFPKAAIIAFPSVSETIADVIVIFNGFPSSLKPKPSPPISIGAPLTLFTTITATAPAS